MNIHIDINMYIHTNILIFALLFLLFSHPLVVSCPLAYIVCLSHLAPNQAGVSGSHIKPDKTHGTYKAQKASKTCRVGLGFRVFIVAALWTYSL